VKKGEIFRFFSKKLRIKYKTLDESFKQGYCIGEQDIFLSMLRYGASCGEPPVFKCLGILPFSFACPIPSLAITMHLAISPGFSGGVRVVRVSGRE
jgi:hypothetical protein